MRCRFNEPNPGVAGAEELQGPCCWLCSMRWTTRSVPRCVISGSNDPLLVRGGVSAERPTRAPIGDALANRGLTHAFEPGIAELIASYYRRQVSPPFYFSHTDGDFYDYTRAASQPQLGPSDLTPQHATSCRSTTISSGSTKRAAANP
jgi:hypothetical protein